MRSVLPSTVPGTCQSSPSRSPLLRFASTRRGHIDGCEVVVTGDETAVLLFAMIQQKSTEQALP